MTFAGTSYGVVKVDSTGGRSEGNQRRIRQAKSSRLPLIPWSDLSLHDNGLWRVADGVVYLQGVDGITVPQGGVNRTYDVRPDAYGVDDDGVPLAALVRVRLEDVADWEASNAQTKAHKKLVNDQAAAVLAEYVGRKERDYQVARVAGSVLSNGVHLPTLREQLKTLGVSVVRASSGRIVVSLPAGGGPHRQQAAKYADIATRYSDLLVEAKLTCDISRCSRAGVWATNCGAVICDHHAAKSR